MNKFEACLDAELKIIWMLVYHIVVNDGISKKAGQLLFSHIGAARTELHYHNTNMRIVCRNLRSINRILERIERNYTSK